MPAISESLRHGARVKVFKGRKVPIGTEGIVKAISIKQKYIAVRIVDDKGNSYWTYETNIKLNHMGSWIDFHHVYESNIDKFTCIYTKH